MDPIAYVAQYSDIGAGAILVAVIISIFTGFMVPGRTHKRELDAANQRADEWREAHRLSEEKAKGYSDQNSVLLAGVRIADKFYKDFLPAVDESTLPHVGSADVRA